jgi:hypothetical protein
MIPPQPLESSALPADTAPPPAYALPRIPYLRLRFTLVAERHARLPRYQGSLLRGAFGHALRVAVCAMGPAQECESCRLRRACVYTRVFETFVEDEPPPLLRGLPTSPRPYVFEPLAERCEFPPGAEMEFDLVLIGQAVDLQAYALLAVERMAAGGLGRDRHVFSLARVRCPEPQGGWREVYSPGRAPHTATAAILPPPAEPAPEQVSLRFLTPTRIKVRDHLAPSIAVRPLAFSMLRRVLELAHFHVPGACIDWTFRPLLDHASTVRVVASDLRWHDWERYSNRQQTKMSLGGFVGTLDLAGDLAPLWPLLRTAETLHVGKGATFGLGKLVITAGDRREAAGGADQDAALRP